MTTRRGFLGAMLAAAVAPAIVRAQSLMPIQAPKIIVPDYAGIGEYMGMRIIESDYSHIHDSVRYGVCGVLTRWSIDGLSLRMERIEPPTIFVHTNFAEDLRRAGVPVRRRRQ